MKLNFGLQARYLLAMAVMLAMIILLMLLLLHRQATVQREIGRLGYEVMHSMSVANLSRHGEATVGQLSDALSNPLYYFDLDAIGSIVRNAGKEPDVAYVLVFDPEGSIIHDGSGEISTYGQPMTDPMAEGARHASDAHTQWSEDIVDIAEPIMMGDKRIGGVRVGYSLASMKIHEDQAMQVAAGHLRALNNSHLGWMAWLLGLLIVVCVVTAFYLQRTLVRPIRRLAEAAHAIEVGNYDGQRLDSVRKDELGELIRAFGSMKESIARHDRDVRRMAYTDALTGLTNRLAFRENLDHRLVLLRDTDRQLSLLFADIDDFKRVNDTLGHEAGDEVLLQFANRIREVVEGSGGDDALLARFGGDEFVILVQGYGVQDRATRLAEEIVHELRKPIFVQGRQVFLGASIGITLFPEDASDASVLMKNGDIAMYQAKTAGKNCYRLYSRAMDQAVERRVRMEHELRNAWDRGEMSLRYQPIMRFSDGRIVGAEALLRWRHPEFGSVAPAVFIDVAEHSGLIENIGARVLREACATAAGWNRMRDALNPLFVSVNVSSRQLRGGDLPALVADCLRETGLPSSCLHLELTETAVVGDEAQASLLLAMLHRTGVKVWLDDFGTGFSGLSHLRRVPVDGVKIDRSFIADMLRDADDLALTTAIIAMAHSLGITVVAEGVEKEGQLNLLRERGCDLAQGYWLGKPMTAEEFTARIN